MNYHYMVGLKFLNIKLPYFTVCVLSYKMQAAP